MRKSFLAQLEAAVKEDLLEFIGRGRTNGAPFWLLYGLGTVFTVFGVGLAIGCYPMMQSQLPIEAQGGRIGVGVGLAMLLFGGLMINSGYTKSIADRVEFFGNGLRVVGGVCDGAWRFEQLKTLKIVIIKPGPWLSVEGFKAWCTLALRAIEIRTVQGVVVTTDDYLFGGGEVCLSVNGADEITARSPGLSRLLRFSAAASSARSDFDVKLIQL